MIIQQLRHIIQQHYLSPVPLRSWCGIKLSPQAQANIMQTIQEEDENAQSTRTASKKLTATTLSTTDPSPSAHLDGAHLDFDDLALFQAFNPVPIPKGEIPETRPTHLRNFFNGPPTNLPPSTATSPFNRPIYDNQVPGIPTHWIPIYGAGHGMFYDPLTKLFYGDGAPRPDLERPDGSMPEMDTKEPLPRFGEHPEDVLHLQPRAVTDSLVRRMQATPITGRRYYCKCEHTWLAQCHDCPDDRLLPGMSWSGSVPPVGVMAAIRPADRIPGKSFTHDLVIGDLGYLTPTQRYVYNKQRQ
ncbi:MAG: hypothetical protein Q9171_004773 [Xanthocarpia ochracea]